MIAWNIDWLAIVAGTRATINPSVLESVSEEKTADCFKRVSWLPLAVREMPWGVMHAGPTMSVLLTRQTVTSMYIFDLWRPRYRGSLGDNTQRAHESSSRVVEFDFQRTMELP